MTDELTHQSAAALAALMRACRVSPVEVIEAHLRRIEFLNPRLNAVVTLAPDAIERAREAEDSVMRGDENIGVLCGVPVTIKDTIETKDLRTTSGSPLRATYIPMQDSTAVARLKAAGAIVIGKTNVSEMAMAYDADNPVFGRTNNPHDLTRTPGGSSGGCATAVSACLVPASLGSDLAGSIRVPAHFCGVVGLKPTASGRVPVDGHFPSATGAAALGVSFGPIARHVEDLRLFYNVLAATQSFINTQYAIERQEQATRGLGLRGRCFAWYVDDGVSRVTNETKKAVEAVAGALTKAGMIGVEAQPPGIARAPDLWRTLFQRAALENLSELYAGHEEKAGALVRAVLTAGANMPLPDAGEMETAKRERALLRKQLIDWMRETPLIVAPVGAAHAFPHGTRRVEIEGVSQSIFRAFSYAQTYNVFGLPCVSMPALRSREGLPVGVQIIGRPFAEAEVLNAAAIIEESLGGWMPPPAL
ncbi:MAG: amidase [Pyrinomonadaceae bacterium]